MNPPVKHSISAKPTPVASSPAKKVIDSSQSKSLEKDATVGASLTVQPKADAPLSPPPDPNQAVDYNGTPIQLGMFVDLYYCQVVGLRPDPNNRLNILVIPALNKIVTDDPNNPLNGQLDGKAILVSGYHCVAYPTKGSGASRAAGIDNVKTVSDADAQIEPTPLPSNFLAPSIE